MSSVVCPMNRQQRRASARCRVCRHRPGLRGTGYCGRCVEETRERYRCPDCDSVVTDAVAEGVRSLWIRLPQPLSQSEAGGTSLA